MFDSDLKVRVEALEQSVRTAHLHVNELSKRLDIQRAKLKLADEYIAKLENKLTLLALQSGYEFYMTDEVPAVPAVPSRLEIRRHPKKS